MAEPTVRRGATEEHDTLDDTGEAQDRVKAKPRDVGYYVPMKWYRPPGSASRVANFTL